MRHSRLSGLVRKVGEKRWGSEEVDELVAMHYAKVLVGKSVQERVRIRTFEAELVDANRCQLGVGGSHMLFYGRLNRIQKRRFGVELEFNFGAVRESICIENFTFLHRPIAAHFLLLSTSRQCYH